MDQFTKTLFNLLEIQAPSGKEHKVRNYLLPHLGKLVDHMWVDDAGNLLAEKSFGDSPTTILLSAHMDTVKNVQKGRKVMLKNGVFSSSKGVLGGDDRAGIAIILEVLRNIDTTNFKGKIKIAFCVQEEIGCVGSSKIDSKFITESNLAIVVDRRGNRDIVTSCGSYYPFCSDYVGKFFEMCSEGIGMNWKAVDGGLSDTASFADLGLNGVNLSAGYFNEHTSDEFLVVEYCHDTINLILEALDCVERHVANFGEVPTRQRYYYPSADENWWNEQYYEDEFSNVYATPVDDNFYSKDSYYGRVSACVVDDYAYIVQDYKQGRAHEIFMHEAEFDQLVASYLAYKRDKQADKRDVHAL